MIVERENSTALFFPRTPCTATRPRTRCPVIPVRLVNVKLILSWNSPVVNRPRVPASQDRLVVVRAVARVSGHVHATADRLGPVEADEPVEQVPLGVEGLRRIADAPQVPCTGGGLASVRRVVVRISGRQAVRPRRSAVLRAVVAAQTSLFTIAAQ